MPVTTVTTPGTTTFIDYYVNVTINMVKRAPRVRAWPGFSPLSPSNSAILFSAAATIGRRDDNFVPNTPLSGTTKYVPISAADGFGVLISPMNNASTIVTTTGGYVPTVLYVQWSDIFPVAGTPGTEVPTYIYRIRIPDPTKMPKLCCIEADLGSPFGTIRIIYENSQVNFSTVTPPSGWVRNQERRNASGPASGDCFQVYATGSRMCSAYWMGVFSHDGGQWNRQGSFLNSAVPAFKLNFAQNAYPGYNSTLFHWNYLTNSAYAGAVTVKGQWRKVRHDDHASYNPLAGSYLGASFNLSFTDLNSAGQSPQIVITWGQSLTAPTLPTNEYTGLFLEIVITSGYINGAGSPVTSTDTSLVQVIQFRGSSIPTIEYPYQAPSYWPWDIGQKQYGPDDATVRWVRHAGYRPVSFPPILAETTIAPTLTRVGKAIILQGGRPSYTGATPQITSSTPACTGIIFSTDPTQTNGSQMQASMTLRAVSMEWGAEWSCSSTLTEAQEYTLPSGGAPTGVYRLAYSSNYLAGSTYQGGPGLLTTDICALQNNINGIAGNFTLVSTSTSVDARGMQYGTSIAPARGRIWLTANPADGATITIGDGILKKIFEFDSNSTVTAGNVAVTIGANIDATNATLIAAINSSGLGITASVPTISDLQVELTLCRIVGQSGGFRQSSKRWTVAAP